MDIAVKERLIGAAVLVVIVVVVVPALLSGPRTPTPPEETQAGDTRVVEIDLAGAGARREEAPEGEPGEPVPSLPETAVEALPPAAVPPPGASAPAQAATTPPSAAPADSPRDAPTATQGGWAVQVAALSKQQAAAQMVADLKGKGYAAYLLEHRSGGQVLYRVRVGPESQRAQAEALAGRLRDQGLNPAVVAQP